MMLGRKKANAIKVESQVIVGNLSHILFNWNKKRNYSNAYCNLKGLLPVDDPCLVADEDISEVSQDCVLCIFQLMFF